jgi:FixJ family two-component response regulator
MTESVLFVDDEQNVLSAIRRMLFDEPYEKHFALNADDALALLKVEPVCVIVSDMRMPGTDGVSFLEQSRAILPDAVRLILSGQADMHSVMEAVNRGGIWRYISKPWNDDDMKCTIRNALDLFSVNHERKCLLEELAVKNKQLESFNRELERRVEQRTCLIEAQKKLLHLMVDGVDLAEFTEAAREVLAGLIGSGEFALLHMVGGEQLVSNGVPPTVGQIDALKRSRATGDEIREGAYHTFPIVHSSVNLGALGIAVSTDEAAERITEATSNIIPLIALALGHYKMILDAPEMLSALDDIIGKL